MSFALTNAPANFSKIDGQIIYWMHGVIFIYLDDILIALETLQNMYIGHIKSVLQKLHEAELN